MKKISLLLTGVVIMSLNLPAQIIHVPGDQPTIQAGINAAISGDTVLVAEDIYFENIDFSGKDITVASHYLMDDDTNHINNTVIDGSQPAHPFQGAVVYFTSDEDTTSILCGFTIQNGTGQFPDAWGDRSGGGIYLAESAAKIIHNKIIHNNISAAVGAYGGGIAVNTMENKWVVIEGNTIISNSVQSSGEKSEGGGIYTMCNAIIRDNIIKNNMVNSTNTNYSDAKAFGGGASLVNYSGEPRYIHVNNNTFQNNSAYGLPRGGGLALYKLDGLVNNNFINGNFISSKFTERSWGCGIYIDGTYLGNGFTVENNTIINNIHNSPTAVGGGIGIFDMDRTFIVNANIIKNNEAHFGGGICNKDALKVEITNNVIRNNMADHGGGLFFTDNLFDKSDIRQDDSRGLTNQSNLMNTKGYFPLIMNNAIVNNEAILYGGGLASRQTSLHILSLNNVFWDNTALEGSDVYIDEDCNFHLYYCLIEPAAIVGAWSGENNIFGDPAFKDDSCHIDGANSACWEAGIDTINITGLGTYIAPIVDIDGELRPLNEKYEIGADEAFDIGNNIHEQLKKDSDFHVINVPNPFKKQTTISYKIDKCNQVRINLFTSNGQFIGTLLDKNQLRGEYRVKYDAGNLNPGVYYIQLWTPSGHETQKIVILNE